MGGFESAVVDALSPGLDSDGPLNETFPAFRRRSFDDMIEMIRINISEGLRKGWEGGLDRLRRFRSRFEKEPPAAVDGRMFPHESFKPPGDI